ncbi:Uridine nucleosidase [Erysiphe neolycopersici]|uniref:Uridine nucleosidase n=1 Tax=Erysiphe neolycopersici TaxID=212602 RepID=A0A420HSI1_9PEZI|nr:Uridine nucleosidase [Erysiphe neolycopersici]
MGSKPARDIPDGKIAVWLDCDPGHDIDLLIAQDAFALLLIAQHPRLHALGVSTTHGNAPLCLTTSNALSLLTAFRSDHIPVHPGASKPLNRPSICANEIHGKSGIDGTDLLPEPKCCASSTPALFSMARALLNTPRGSAWIVCTGALTNLALLLRTYPQVATWVAGVSIMGGAIGDGFTNAPMGELNNVPRCGNITFWAEFNIIADPEAAQEVLNWPTLRGKITLIPLDLTHLVIATESVMNELFWGKNTEGKSDHQNIVCRATNKLRQMMVELLTFFADTYAGVYGLKAGPPLHDPVAVAVLLSDEVPFNYGKHAKTNQNDSSSTCEDEQFEITVITKGSFADAKARAQTGRTLVRSLPPGEKGVRIPRGIDVDAFWMVIQNCLKRVEEM